MQVKRWRASSALALGLCVAGATTCAGADGGEPRTTNGLMRVFADSKHLLVRSLVQDVSVPVGRLGTFSLHYNNERVTVPAIVAAAGSQEAVDAITTASRPIRGNAFQDFHKTRNEFTGAVEHGGATVEYYHSIESDYLGHQLGGSYQRDVRGDQLNLSLGTSYSWDDIEPLANDNTNSTGDRKTTLHLNAIATQVLTPTTVVRVGLEDNIVDGLQHNPYRRVYAGGASVPENHPRSRERRDAFVKVHQYLHNKSSVKLDYRLYSDDWGVLSHQVNTQLSQYLTHGLFAQYEYRYYTQSAADFYRPEYATTGGVGGYLTGDYRLGSLSSHLFGVAVNVDLASLAADTPALRRFNLSLDYERYFNSNNYSADILETGIDFRF